MTYDHLKANVADLNEMVTAARDAADRCRADLAWFDAFPEDAVATAEAELAHLTTELAAATAQQETAKAKVAVHRTVAGASTVATVTFGWFERNRPGVGAAAATQSLISSFSGWRDAKKKLAAITRRRDELEASLERAQAAITEARAGAQRHAGIDRDALAAELAGWEAQLHADEPELERLAAQLADIDDKLGSWPTEYLRHRALREDAEARYGPASDQAKMHRSREKRVADQIATIKRRGTLNVRTVLIDGCNLLYENDTNNKLGLFPLRTLYDRLSEDKQVIVYFDHTITTHLQVPNLETVAKQMGDREVRFVPSKLGADEVILNMADDLTTYVISNDTYLQYEDKPAMVELRVVNAVIDDTLRKVTVPDFDLTVDYRKDK